MLAIAKNNPTTFPTVLPPLENTASVPTGWFLTTNEFIFSRAFF